MRDEAHAAGIGSGIGGTRQMLSANSVVRDDNESGNSSPSVSMIITIATCFGCLIFITNLIIVGLVLHRRHQRKNSRLKRIPGTDSRFCLETIAFFWYLIFEIQAIFQFQKWRKSYKGLIN